MWVTRYVTGKVSPWEGAGKEREGEKEEREREGGEEKERGRERKIRKYAHSSKWPLKDGGKWERIFIHFQKREKATYKGSQRTSQ